MRTYYIPRNYKGETRILYIFTVKSMISTVIGLAIGAVFYFILKILGVEKIGFVILAIFGVIGWAIGAIKIPTIAGLPVTRKIGGEPISEIIFRYIRFKKDKKIYTYTNEEDE